MEQKHQGPALGQQEGHLEAIIGNHSSSMKAATNEILLFRLVAFVDRLRSITGGLVDPKTSSTAAAALVTFKNGEMTTVFSAHPPRAAARCGEAPLMQGAGVREAKPYAGMVPAV